MATLNTLVILHSPPLAALRPPSPSASFADFYQITSITGQRNGVPIISLVPTGHFIPGNDGFPVDNLIRLALPKKGRADQLTVNGFGMQLVSGASASPFYGDFLTPPGYLEPYAALPIPAPKGLTSELPVAFTAFPLARASQTVILMRHAERPRNPLKSASSSSSGSSSSDSNSNSNSLAPQGVQRAECVARVYAAPAMGVQCLYAPTPTSAAGSSASAGLSRRALDTIAPLAQLTGLSVNVAHEATHTSELTDAIKVSACEVAVVVWERAHLPAILAKLGVARLPPPLDEERYDAVYTVRGGVVVESAQPEECTFA